MQTPVQLRGVPDFGRHPIGAWRYPRHVRTVCSRDPIGDPAGALEAPSSGANVAHREGHCAARGPTATPTMLPTCGVHSSAFEKTKVYRLNGGCGKIQHGDSSINQFGFSLLSI
uniref:Uncharacterized protein n=1 Tax=Ananas comosus var. bracteatus TaxID=296719 RepID=A0A6V7QI72_ANACO|nr:unnamed protein product [Ananas comosus var. bracteatus]